MIEQPQGIVKWSGGIVARPLAGYRPSSAIAAGINLEITVTVRVAATARKSIQGTVIQRGRPAAYVSRNQTSPTL
jgi:hypothetical protein